VAAGKHRLPDLGALLSRQRDIAAAGLALLGLAWRSLALRGGLTAGSTLLALLALRSLALGLIALHLARPLSRLALSLSRRLVAVALAALRLSLVGLSVLALRSLLALRRLTRGLIMLTALHRPILRLALPLLCARARAVLACGAALHAWALRRRALRAA
jgi:hypothetical protein